MTDRPRHFKLRPSRKDPNCYTGPRTPRSTPMGLPGNLPGMQIVLGEAGELLAYVGEAPPMPYPDPSELTPGSNYVEACTRAGEANADLASALERALRGGLERIELDAPRTFGLKLVVQALRPSGAMVTVDSTAGGSREETLRTLINEIPIACIRMDTQYRITHVNRAFESLFGYSKEELIGRVPFEFIVAPEHVSFVHSLFELMTIDEFPEGPSLGENVTKDGRRFLSEWTNARLCDADDTFTGVFCACIDITDRTRMQHQVEESKQRYRSLLETLPDAVLVTRGLTLTFANSAAAELLDASAPKELLGRPLTEVLDPISHSVVSGEECLVQASLPQRVVLRTLEGKALSAECIATPLADDQDVPGMLVVFRDMRQRERLEQELQQKQKLEVVGQLASGIAHDFNNVLSVILAACDLLTTRQLDTSKAREEIGFIRDAAESAAALVRQLLAFARRRPSEPKVFDVNRLVDSCTALLRRLSGEGVELLIEGAPELWRVRADPRQVEQVVVNLVANARAAMPSGGTLRITTKNVEVSSEGFVVPGLSPGRYVELNFADSGHGMDADTLARVFEPFFTTRKQGVGLGLATSDAIVSQSGGRILVESEVGRGTVFRVYLPASGQPTQAAADPMPSPQVATQDASILVVDDNLALHSLAARILRQAGYRVFEARNASTALELLLDLDQPLDLLLTDVVMPGMSGPELARELLTLQPGLAVLYMSGYADDLLERYGLSLSSQSMIQKPFAPRRLLDQVATALALRRSRT
jgi:two-component system, cell cycle sensor histidine kinase and response regulator CckA